mmetsp:Transcript_94430/g.131242  ORF Transcript_94430/g.131242 Transcript_94430/m.131242 type:complete len:96 (+) Transcript_94430:80-367(+)
MADLPSESDLKAMIKDKLMDDFDKNKDGKIDRGELKEAIEDIKEEVGKTVKLGSAADPSDLLKKFDADGNGVLEGDEIDEFVTALAQWFLKECAE